MTDEYCSLPPLSRSQDHSTLQRGSDFQGDCKAGMTDVFAGNVEARPSTLHIQPLPFQLDFSCPIDLPSKPVCGAIWPWALAYVSSSPSPVCADWGSQRSCVRM